MKLLSPHLPGVEYLEGIHLFVWRPRGVLSEEQVNKIVLFVGKQERKFGPPFNRFTDLSLLDAVDLTFNYVFHIALYRRLARLGQEPVKSAFLVTNPAVARYVKLHALMTDRSPIKVKIFKDSLAAAAWLGVDVGVLEARAES
jgi:hypothetical protein